MKEIVKINLNDELPQVDILNMDWKKYNHLMIAIEGIISLLENEIKDAYYDSKRKDLVLQYKELLNNLITNEIPYKGQAESIDQNIIQILLKNKI